MTIKHLSHHERRLPYEFTFETKKEALIKFDYRCCKCESQDNRTARLEINHRVAIWFALEMGDAISAVVIKSIANAEPLCERCHREYHINESRQFYAELYPEVVKEYLLSIIDPHKDDWRDDVRRAYYATAT